MKINAIYFLIIPLFLMACSKKDDSEPIQKPIQSLDTFFIGRVIDQVSKLPVANADVILGAYPYSLGWAGISNWGVKCTTNENGNYKLTVKKELISWKRMRELEYTPCLFASKAGYAGSTYCHIYDSQIQDIVIYHPSTLRLRVWNDTLNNDFDDFTFAVIGSGWREYPGYVGRYDRYGFPLDAYRCTGRKYDKIFEWTSLWGNMNYSIRNVSGKPVVSLSFVLKPDSIASFSISF